MRFHRFWHDVGRSRPVIRVRTMNGKSRCIMRRNAVAYALALLVCASGLCSSQELLLSHASVVSDTGRAIASLAEQALVAYKDDNRDRYLDNRFRMEMVASRYGDAAATLRTLRTMRGNRVSPSAAASDLLFEILANAKDRSRGADFDEAFRREFRDVVGRLDDRTAALLLRALGVASFPLERAVWRALPRDTLIAVMPLDKALALIKAYQIFDAFRITVLLVPPLAAEDDRRRYVVERDIQVKMPDGATVCALMMRPRSSAGRLPTLLDFTIYADSVYNDADARRAASNGYVGMVGFTRGKRCSPDAPVPFVHDGADAAALINWIARQPWSDGRVGMFNGSYDGFTQWAATKHMPTALKTIVAGAAAAPGIDVPMDSNLFFSFVYPWPFYTTNLKGLDDSTYYGLYERWNKLNNTWYRSGRAYRDLDKIDGTPNPFFDEWLAHPTYDAYWQGMIPFRKEFSRINIPVLQTAGYYYGGPGATLYYLTQHYKFNPRAEHYLVIGPYDHILGQRGMINAFGDTVTTLGGYPLDPVALVDLVELRFQWFDYIFKGGSKPAMLRDRINYQIMGANRWGHAPSIAAMSDRTESYYLSAKQSGDFHSLTSKRTVSAAPLAMAVNFADRSDVDRRVPGGGVLDTAIDTANGVAFVSEAISKPMEVSGLFSGYLDLITNKKDFDFQVSLYELTAKLEYVLLSTYWSRASAVGDITRRTLLTPGKREHLSFTSVRLMSRRVQEGSKLVVLINVIKQPDMQINYGSGRDVSDETIADAREPLRINWFGDSFISVPVKH
jgi:uncharacterized protein